jgi:hypothetical protein
VYIFAASFKGIYINVVRFLVVGTDQILKRILARTSLLQKIKKAWRDRAQHKEPLPAET